MKTKPKFRLNEPSGRPKGIPQPAGPERIKRDQRVIWDSLLKRARAGEPDAVRACVEMGLLDPNSEEAKSVIKEG